MLQSVRDLFGDLQMIATWVDGIIYRRGSGCLQQKKRDNARPILTLSLTNLCVHRHTLIPTLFQLTDHRYHFALDIHLVGGKGHFRIVGIG